LFLSTIFYCFWISWCYCNWYMVGEHCRLRWFERKYIECKNDVVTERARSKLKHMQSLLITWQKIKSWLFSMYCSHFYQAPV
jgi:hypothetical protein